MASTTTTTTTTTTGTGTALMDRRTNHCNSCNTDLSTSNSLFCSHCISHLPSNPNPNSSQLPIIPPFINPFTPSTTTDSSITASDDNFRLDSPYLHRLIHHLRHSNDSSPSTTTTAGVSNRHSPTSKSAIEAIPTVIITDSFLEIDPIVLCAVCKDQFVVNDETKQLPCKHIYHPDCILPWLSQCNSCPVCRFQMPIEPVNGGVKIRRRSRSRVLGFGNLMEDVDDEAMLGIGFTNLHGQYMQSEIDPNVMFPFSHIGQTVDVDVLPDSELENGGENVSS